MLEFLIGLVAGYLVCKFQVTIITWVRGLFKKTPPVSPA